MRTRDDKCNDVARHQVISVQQTYPVEVDVEIKLSTWPGVTVKYSPTAFAAMSADPLAAVTTAVESSVTHIGKVDTIRTCLVCEPNGVVNCVALVCVVFRRALDAQYGQRLRRISTIKKIPTNMAKKAGAIGR